MIRPPQTVSAVNGSIGGEKSWPEHKEKTAEELEKAEGWATTSRREGNAKTGRSAGVCVWLEGGCKVGSREGRDLRRAKAERLRLQAQVSTRLMIFA